LVRDQITDDFANDATVAFWPWACAAYAKTGVADSLIAAQDRAGLNVNLALWACWTATRFEAVPESAIRRAMDVIERWNANVTKPLRAARRGVKPFASDADYDGADDLRKIVKQAELDAERIETMLLEKLAIRILTPSQTADAPARARKNLAAYAALAGASRADGFSTALLHNVIDHIFVAPREPASASKERNPS